ncbi:proteoglycan 4-like [Haliotis rubra]|uniref:proteoglycan 4-like n=1 Tax=Haliotis rubra TaxID=36100 RepID=UPI001EE610F4|nr:proteoglycan 4-like [Haliotis rubra]
MQDNAIRKRTIDDRRRQKDTEIQIWKQFSATVALDECSEWPAECDPPLSLYNLPLPRLSPLPGLSPLPRLSPLGRLSLLPDLRNLPLPRLSPYHACPPPTPVPLRRLSLLPASPRPAQPAPTTPAQPAPTTPVPLPRLSPSTTPVPPTRPAQPAPTTPAQPFSYHACPPPTPVPLPRLPLPTSVPSPLSPLLTTPAQPAPTTPLSVKPPTRNTVMPRLNEAQRNNAIGRLEASESRSDVARAVNVHPRSLHPVTSPSGRTTTVLTTAFLRNHNIIVLPWPSKSPDLNPIEHLWDELDRRLRRRQPQPQTLPQLAAALQAEWTSITQNVIRHLIASMGRRCQAVIDAHGRHTGY